MSERTETGREITRLVGLMLKAARNGDAREVSRLRRQINKLRAENAD